MVDVLVGVELELGLEEVERELGGAGVLGGAEGDDFLGFGCGVGGGGIGELDYLGDHHLGGGDFDAVE